MIEANKSIVRRAIEEGWNQGNDAILNDVYDTDCAFFQEGGGSIHGIASIHEWVRTIRTAFPDLSYTIEAIYGEGDKVATRYTVRGTNSGPFRGLEATGRSFELTGHFIHRIAQSKIVEGWGCWDVVGLLQQLGTIPQINLGGGA